MKHLLRPVARTLELSLATHSHSSNEQLRAHRKQEISNIPNIAERSIARGIDTFSAKHIEAATISLSGLARIIGGFSYVGNGAFSSVYKRGDEVTKVYRHTALMTESDRKRFMLERANMCKSLETHLGTMVATQTLSISEHPLGDYQVVIARQPYVEGESLDLFETNTLRLNRLAVTAYCERQPTGKKQLLELAEGTFESDENTGMVPDMNGVDNFRLVGHNERLKLIDVEPISPIEHPSVHDHILRQAEILADFLEAA